MKKRILVFSDWYLPGYKAGGPITSVANLVDRLRHEFDFYILTRNTDYLESEPYTDVESDIWTERRSGEFVYYMSSELVSTANISKVVRDLKADVWYINGVYSRFFSFLPVRLGNKMKDRRMIVAPRGMLSRQGLTVKPVKKYVFVSFARNLNLYRNVSFQATTNQERADIKTLFPGKKVHVIPNLAKAVSEKHKKREKRRGDCSFVSVARIAREKNTLAAVKFLHDWTMSEGYDKAYTVSFKLYGEIYDREYWEECKDVIAQLPENIKVVHMGSIPPDKIPSVLAASHFFYLPTSGENFGHSIVEAFGNGVPVLISDRTPWRNLNHLGKSVETAGNDSIEGNTNQINQENPINPSPGWDVNLEDVDSFVSRIHECVLMEQEKYDLMSESALDFARTIHADSEVLLQYKKLFNNES